MEWLGTAQTSFTHSPSTIKLNESDGTESDLSTVCRESTPPCKLNPLLFNGHLQTMWTAIGKEGPHLHYKRKIFEASDQTYAGTFAVDFLAEPSSETDETLPIRTTYFSDNEFKNMKSSGFEDDRPMLVILHGLSGGSYEIYLRHVLDLLVKTDGEEKWEACVVNSRGCARHKITSSILYNARATWDCRQTISWLRQNFPHRRLYGLGFSLGANILTNYIGEEGSACVLEAAVVISNPWSLEVGSAALRRTWLGREVYSKTMGGNMKRLLELHYDFVSQNPKLDFEKIRKAVYLHEFDRLVQGPTWGYPTEGAYYRDASSTDALLAVKIPLFAINAVDDPIVTNEAIPYEEIKKNPYTVLCTTSLGGHLSWFEIGGFQWHARPTVNFLKNMALMKVKKPTKEDTSDADGKYPGMVIFDPIRHKLHA
ncbi:unnamed protein product [Blumeria hordei]|uniref:alcohol O-acetyltransferase n=1 Tax=Blumeria hordei TaxID=2867405 RepID=A0A383UW73_BLUHO|nr:unnamed protein product [Blumeria hordei]